MSYLALALSGGFFVAAVFIPKSLILPNYYWMKFGAHMHRITSFVSLAIVFLS